MTRRPSSVELKTHRLRLRAVVPGDEKAVHALLSDENIVRYMQFPLFSEEQAYAFVAQLQERSALQPPQVVYGMVDPRTHEFVGLCGLVLKPELEDGEAWYLLRQELWGNGLVTEAVRALMDYGFGDLKLHRIWASCLPENPGSARVLEKLGFRREGLLKRNLRIHGEWRDSHLYAVLAEEWPT